MFFLKLLRSYYRRHRAFFAFFLARLPKIRYRTETQKEQKARVGPITEKMPLEGLMGMSFGSREVKVIPWPRTRRFLKQQFRNASVELKLLEDKIWFKAVLRSGTDEYGILDFPLNLMGSKIFSQWRRLLFWKEPDPKFPWLKTSHPGMYTMEELDRQIRHAEWGGFGEHDATKMMRAVYDGARKRQLKHWDYSDPVLDVPIGNVVGQGAGCEVRRAD